MDQWTFIVTVEARYKLLRVQRTLQGFLAGTSEQRKYMSYT